MSKKIGRNDPCPCGSGKKYKMCCYDKDHAVKKAEEPVEPVVSEQADEEVVADVKRKEKPVHKGRDRFTGAPGLKGATTFRPTTRFRGTQRGQ